MPTIAELFARATEYHRAGQLGQAEQLYLELLQAEPGHVETNNLLGAVYGARGNLDAAIRCFQRVVELAPAHYMAPFNLGLTLERQGNLPGAIDWYRRVLALKPDYAEAHNKLGSLLERRGDFDAAAECYVRAVTHQPDHVDAHNNLGAFLANRGALDAAAECFQRALALKPDFVSAMNNMGFVAAQQKDFDAAIGWLRRALQVQPNHLDAHNNLGTILARQGNTDAAMAEFQRVLQIQPAFATALSNYLLSLQYHSSVSLASLATAHQQFEARYAAPLRAGWTPHANTPDRQRRLRLGFVSADLGLHAVGLFLIRAFEHLDRQQAEIVCYSDRLSRDTMTRRLREAATIWRDVRALDHEALAAQIRADAIDILFDLAGHTDTNRMLTFARKPAPIQISWLGYVGTTGLTAMDYVLADRFEVPETAEPHLVERVLRMPDGYVCFEPPSDAPPVSPLPASQRGFVTFGSFNHPAKITSHVIALWARILSRVDSARLVLKFAGFDVPSVRERIESAFASHGISAERLELSGWSAHDELMRQYQHVDIALDPFPYGGGLTTCEAIWMGVPVVTCPGETFASRHALSHLSNAGFTESIAETLDQYAELAVALALDLPGLAAIRSRLRQQVTNSPLCDGQRFADNLLAVLRKAWIEWCDQQRS